MSYEAQTQLANDPTYAGRVGACCVQQSEVPGVGDTSPAATALADGIKRDDGPYHATFVRLSAGGPGIADKVDNGDGTIDQAKVTDADLLSIVQSLWPTIADLYFAADGSPLT